MPERGPREGEAGQRRDGGDRERDLVGDGRLRAVGAEPEAHGEQAARDRRLGPHLDAVEAQRERARARREVVAGPEGEEREAPTSEGAVGAQLVVPVAERDAVAQPPDDGARVRVARRDGDRALSRQRRRHHRARVVETHIDGGVHVVLGRDARVRRDDARHVAAVARRVAAREEVEVLEEVRVDHRRAEREVEQRGHAQVVEEVARVAGVAAAHGVDRRGPRDGRHAGERLDGAERIAQGARRVRELVAARGARPGGSTARARRVS